MTNGYLVSICIPSIIERIDKFSKLIKGLYKQIETNNLNDYIEIVSMIDNRTQPLSYKRNMLQNKSKGKYFIHLDDDDDLADDYVITVYNHIKGIKNDVDVITYYQLALVNDKKFKVMSDLNSSMELTYVGNDREGSVFKRYAWQWCLWHKRFKTVYRSDIDTNAREDQNWLKRVKLEYPKTQSNIPKVLHTYNFQDPTESSCQ